MSRRADGEQEQAQLLAVSVPAMFDESSVGIPTVREQRRMTVEYPSKIDPLVNYSGEAHDLTVMTKVTARRQHAVQQERRVD